MFKLITSLPSSGCFLYGFTGTIFHVTLHRHTHPTPLLQNTSSGWQDPAFDAGSGNRCGGERDVISVHQPTEHICSSGAASSLFNKIKAVNETRSHPPTGGVNGIHAVTSPTTSHLRHSAVQPDTLPDGDTVITSGCASVYFIFFFFYCIVTLFI